MASTFVCPSPSPRLAPPCRARRRRDPVRWPGKGSAPLRITFSVRGAHRLEMRPPVPRSAEFSTWGVGPAPQPP